ncbi:MAG: hypothetical protein LBH50_01295 [Spirochaetaceae bacterium]|jgi:hypothetical protein|nr:hypothetical protein [Spirochaetaceae bacterium]
MLLRQVFYRKKLVRAVFLALALFSGGLSAVSALDVPLRKIADDSALRRKLFDPWFIEAPSRVLSKAKRLETLPDGARIEVRTERERGEFGIVLARESGGAFSGWTQGSWVVTRNVESGALLRIRFFPRSDPYTYIQFRPLDGGRSLMDAVAYGAYLAQSASVPLSFERLLTASLRDILHVADNRELFRYFEPEPENYAGIRTLVTRLRQRLPELSFADDGAINENGDYVFINTLMPQTEPYGLNCSGFAKWLVDGLLLPVTGSRLPISMLKQPYGERGSSLTRPYESLRDPFFGLDWTRNLAAAANAAIKSPAFAVLDEIEVRESPFSQIIVRKGGTSRTEPYTGFLPDAGFAVKGLPSLLYALAIDEPGVIYLGAVNAEMLPKPRMRQYFHIAAFLPYFDGDGVFHVAVFESAAETSFSRFVARYPENYINLVRLPSETIFEP